MRCSVESVTGNLAFLHGHCSHGMQVGPTPCYFLALACFDRLLMKLSMSLIAVAASLSLMADAFGGFVTL